MSGAEYLARALERYGATHVFLVPTIASQTLVAMEETTGIARIVTHSEKAAVYMADGYARASGRVGVCMAQNVGRANLAAGLQDPYLAGSPVLALTGGQPPQDLARHVYQEIDAFPMFGAVTKASTHVGSTDRLPEVLRQAMRTATVGRPGPVHIELEGREGEAVEGARAELDVTLDPRFGRVPPFRPPAPVEAIDAALRAIEAAERPVVVAGGGVRASGAAAQLVAFAEALSLPIATSLNAKDVVQAAHPLAVGVVGSYSRASANRAVMEADLVVFVGSRTGSQTTLNWQVPPPTTATVHIDIDPVELGRHYPRCVPVLGDARVVLQQLRDAAAASGTRDRTDWTGRVAGFVAAYHEQYADLFASDAVPIRPERLCRELTGILPEDALLVADTGHAGMWSGGMIDLLAPGQGFLRAAGSLGWGLPASIGASLAVPDRPVVAFVGDGGFWDHVAELETATRWEANVVVVVNDNRALNQEIHPFRRAYGGELRGRHHELWHFGDTDLAAVATAMGASGIRVTEPADLRGALRAALATRGPVVVDVVTDIEALAPLGVGPERTP